MLNRKFLEYILNILQTQQPNDRNIPKEVPIPYEKHLYAQNYIMTLSFKKI